MCHIRLLFDGNQINQPGGKSMPLPNIFRTNRTRSEFHYEDDNGSEHTVMAEYSVHEASSGSREAGVQMEPDEPRSFELYQTYIMVGDQWQVWRCSNEQNKWFEDQIEESGF
jgi:hypothetical protein